MASSRGRRDRKYVHQRPPSSIPATLPTYHLSHPPPTPTTSQEKPPRPNHHQPPADITIPAPSTSTTKTLPLRIYKPTTPRQDPSASPALPTVVWYHGGGWTNGTLDSEHAQCLRLASLCPCAAVVAVGYGLLPENGTAGMLDDCLAGFTWARSRSRSPVVVLGGSAGGALALGVAYRLGLAGRGDEVAGVVALYPVAVHPARLPGRWEGVHASFGELEGTAPLVRGVDQLDVLGGFLFVSFFPSFPRLWSTHLHPLFFFFSPSYAENCMPPWHHPSFSFGRLTEVCFPFTFL